jgi:hypothetical protein
MMIRRKFFLLVLLACLISGPVVLAAPNGGLAINWWTVDGGGGQSSGGPYVLMGTAGQPDAFDVRINNCGDYLLVGGFWTPPAGITGICQLFLPAIAK